MAPLFTVTRQTTSCPLSVFGDIFVTDCGSVCHMLLNSTNRRRTETRPPTRAFSLANVREGARRASEALARIHRDRKLSSIYPSQVSVFLPQREQVLCVPPICAGLQLYLSRLQEMR